MPTNVELRAEELNAPCVTLTRALLKQALYSTEESAVKAILTNIPVTRMQFLPSHISGEIEHPHIYGRQIGHVWVSRSLENKGFDEEYLNTPIAGKRVFAPFYRGGGYLPTVTDIKYEVAEPDAPVELPDISDYREVMFDGEATLADLYINAHKYNYYPDMNAYAPLPEQGALQNAAKTLMMKEIMIQCGDPYDRIADLSRLILFLMSKVTLTESEQNILTPLLAYVPNIYDLAPIAEREKNVQKIVSDAKANPETFIKGESSE